MFSSVDDDVVSNMAELTSRLPIAQQPEFATLLDTGRISLAVCRINRANIKVA